MLQLIITYRLIGFPPPFRYGDSFIWDLPTATWRQGKERSLRETAERAIRECCGEGLQVQVMGNAPLGYFKETYSK